MVLKNKKYYIASYRTILLGFLSLFIGVFTFLLIISTIELDMDFSLWLLLPFISALSLFSNYFGIKTLLRFNKFVQIELQDHQLKYLRIGKGRGAGLDYYINPKFEFIKYHDIKFINIIVYQYFDKKIQILLNDGTIIILMLLFNSTSELEEIVFEIKKRLNLV